jgi:hypothetical protein
VAEANEGTKVTWWRLVRDYDGPPRLEPSQWTFRDGRWKPDEGDWCRTGFARAEVARQAGLWPSRRAAIEDELPYARSRARVAQRFLTDIEALLAAEPTS